VVDYVHSNKMTISQLISTSDGEIIIEGPVAPEVISHLEMDEGLRAFRPPKRQKQALLEISGIPDGRIIIAHSKSKIVGYVTFHPPDSFERWFKGPREVRELGAIEVSPKVRRYGVGRKLLEVSFSDPIMENFLIVVTEYYWHWDLENNGLHVWEYRELMRKLMSHVGMVVKDTDDEEICAHPANMLMVRYGKNLSKDCILEFEHILFEKPDSNRG
jgi:acetoin utilization protein AcuA